MQNHNLKNNRIGQRGYTLIEMMVVVAVIGILAGVSIPSFAGYMKRQKIRGAAEALKADVAYTRSLAIARRTTFRIVFVGTEYRIIQPGPNTIIRSHEAPDGLAYLADVNPNFYAHGLSDAANISIDGGADVTSYNLLPNGTMQEY